MGGSSSGPIEGGKKVEPDWSRIPPVQKDKQRREESYDSLTKEAISKPLFFAIIVYYMKKFFAFFSGRRRAAELDIRQLAQDLLAFRTLLQTLQSEDKSYDLDFVQKLSELWHNVTEDCNLLAADADPRLTDLSVQLKILLREIRHFPPNEEHSFGFYLDEFVGNQWLPFPFLDILRQLHSEAEHKTLERWSAKLQNLANRLKERV